MTYMTYTGTRTICLLVNVVTKRWPAYRGRPTEGVNLTKTSEFAVCVARGAKFEREDLYTGSVCG